MKEKTKKFKQILDEKGKPIKNVTAIITYQDGFVVATPDGLYTNVTSLITKK